MYRIGEFSVISKTTIKTLRYYEKEKLLLPAYIDERTGYRYYDSKQLVNLSRIVSMRQIGISISDIKKVLSGFEVKEILLKKKHELESNISLCNTSLSKINYLLEEKNMKNEIFLKELPAYTIYYKEGKLSDFSEITSFILSSGEECLKLNPNIKCIEPDYCYVSYLDDEYRDHDIKIRYAQAVEKEGVGNDSIKFETLKPVNAVCIYHKGSYENLGESYGAVLKYIEDNGYEIIDYPRERYIDGVWNKKDANEWLTEIQIPIKSDN